MTVSREQIDAIVEYLTDNNSTLSDAVEVVVGDFHGEDTLTEVQKEDIYSRVFVCSGCMYWFPQEVSTGDETQKCEDCVSTDFNDDNYDN